MYQHKEWDCFEFPYMKRFEEDEIPSQFRHFLVVRPLLGQLTVVFHALECDLPLTQSFFSCCRPVSFVNGSMGWGGLFELVFMPPTWLGSLPGISFLSFSLQSSKNDLKVLKAFYSKFFSYLQLHNTSIWYIGQSLFFYFQASNRISFLLCIRRLIPFEAIFFFMCQHHLFLVLMHTQVFTYSPLLFTLFVALAYPKYSS